MPPRGEFKKPYRCTGCAGRGNVEIDGWLEAWSWSGRRTVPCIPCFGTGIIWSAEDPWDPEVGDPGEDDLR